MAANATVVVGGTDGSGTRSVVNLLQLLGIPMLVEDPATNDAHGAEFGGWPNLVTPIIADQHAAVYELDKLDPAVAQFARASISDFVELKQMQTKRLHSSSIAGGWGFKAPSAMLVLPVLEATLPAFKFVHVVRDGRDIAFSSNQSPVEKFYELMYGNTDTGGRQPTSPRGRAIRLWSDWNVAVKKWAEGRTASDPSRVQYFVLHAERLVDSAAALGAVQELARFVGSTLSEEELCFLASEITKSKGSHEVMRDGEQLLSRYGKWRLPVENDPSLGDELEAFGGAGLNEFGYRVDGRWSTGLGAACDSGSATLTSVLTSVGGEMAVKASSSGDCLLTLNSDLKGETADVGVAAGLADPDECCLSCVATSGCHSFTYVPMTGMCWQKGELVTDPEHAFTLVSGEVIERF